MSILKKTSQIFLILSVLIAMAAGEIVLATAQQADAVNTELEFNHQDFVPYDPVPEPSQEELEAQRQRMTKSCQEDVQIAEQYFLSEDDIQYYAYLDYETAAENLKPVILAARNRIIYRYSWVADGTSGRIVGKDGIVKQELPQFSDIFPEDWALPIEPASAVDLAYYNSLCN